MKRRFIQVYHDREADPRFSGLSNAEYGLHVRLEVIADAAWPSAAPLPRWADGEEMDALLRAGLVQLEPRDMFRMAEVDQERQARSDLGRLNAEKRWDPNGGPMGGHRGANGSPLLPNQTRPEADQTQTRPEPNQTPRDELLDLIRTGQVGKSDVARFGLNPQSMTDQQAAYVLGQLS